MGDTKSSAFDAAMEIVNGDRPYAGDEDAAGVLQAVRNALRSL